MQSNQSNIFLSRFLLKEKKERYHQIYFNIQYITILVLRNFVKPHCIIFSLIFCLLFLIDAIKHSVEKKFKTCFILLRDCLGEVSRKRPYKIKQFCFFSCYVFWRQQKLYSKEIRKYIHQLVKSKVKIIDKHFIVLKQPDF